MTNSSGEELCGKVFRVSAPAQVTLCVYRQTGVDRMGSPSTQTSRSRLPPIGSEPGEHHVAGPGSRPVSVRQIS